MTKSKILLVLANIAIANILFAQTKNDFSLQQAVDYGLKNTVQVKNALLDVKLQEQQNREITAAAFPQVNANIGMTHYIDIPVQSFPNSALGIYSILISEGVKNGSGSPIAMPNLPSKIPFPFGVPWVANGGIDVSQILFDGQVFVGLQARNTAIELAKRNADVTSDQIKANIQKVYWQLVVGKKQLGSIEANITRFEKLLNDTREIYKNGFVEKLDVNKVQVQLNNLKTEKEKIVNQLDAGNAGLKFLISMPQKDTLVLSDTLTDEIIKSNILDESYTYTERKEMKVLESLNKMNAYNIKRYKLSRIPTIALFGSYSKNAQREKFNFFDKDDWFTTSLMGVKINIPIFDGFARRAKIEGAKLSLEKTKNSIEQLKQLIDYDVTNAKTKMKSAVLTLDNQKQNIKLAEEVYSTTKIKYEQGLGSNQEIYNAQTELKVAQNNYYAAMYDAITAKIDYLKATGKL